MKRRKVRCLSRIWEEILRRRENARNMNRWNEGEDEKKELVNQDLLARNLGQASTAGQLQL